MNHPASILEMIDAFRRSQTMFTAVEMGLFDRLDDGPKTGQALAKELAAQEDSLTRFLDALVSLGLLDKREDRFANTPHATRFLTSKSPATLAGYIRYSRSVLYPLWSHLDDAVREGSHRWRQTFGFDGSRIFDHFFRSEEAMQTFLMGMNGLGTLSSPAVVSAFDLTRFRTFVDLGGATGHLSRAAVERYPEMRAVLFDLPQVIPFARRLLSGIPGSDRIEFQPGDFFQDPLPPADLYALGRILHDWNAPKIVTLLTRISAALPPGGALLIAEKLFDDDRLGPVPVHMQSLNMLVCTEGRERSLAEYRALLQANGFTAVHGARTGQPVDAVLAFK